MRDILIVDGYNVVNAWPELTAFLDNLEHARDKLLDILAGYGAYKDYKTIVVFDAHAVPGSTGSCEVMPAMDVIYTKEGETADSYIEKMVYYLVRQGERVYVVTSDRAEQMFILGAGAYRISARELRKDVQKVQIQIEDDFLKGRALNSRHELENRLDSEVLRRLEELRRGR